jgi:hypothetical protein
MDIAQGRLPLVYCETLIRSIQDSTDSLLEFIKPPEDAHMEILAIRYKLSAVGNGLGDIQELQDLLDQAFEQLIQEKMSDLSERISERCQRILKEPWCSTDRNVQRVLCDVLSSITSTISPSVIRECHFKVTRVERANVSQWFLNCCEENGPC